MKKLLLMKTVFLLCALVAGSSDLWADKATLTNAEIVAAGDAAGGYNTYAITGGGGKTWNTYAIKNYHSKATNDKFYLQLKKYASNTASYIQIPEYGTKITSIKMTVSSTQKAMDGGENSATLYFSSSNSTSSTGTGVASATGASSVTIDCSSLNLNTGYITTSAGVRIWDVEVTYTAASSNPNISLATSSVSVSAADGDGTINVTYNNIASVDAEVLFYESDGTTAADYSSWLAAEINNSNNLYYVFGENTGAARTAYMKVHQKNTDVYSDLITITQSAPVAVTLDLSSNTGWSFPTSKTEGPGTYTKNGYSIILQGSSGQGYYFDSSNLLLGKSGASLTLPAFGFNVSKIKVYGTSGASGSVTFNIFVGNDAVSTEVTSSKVDHEFAIDAEKQGVGTVYVIKVTSTDNMRITKIEIYGNGCEAGLVSAAGWATYVTEDPVTYAEGDAFAVTSVGTSVELTSVTSVRTGTPLLLKGAGQKTAILLDAEPAAITNKLAVSDGDDGVNDYVLANHNSKVGFYKWTGSALASGKVYLPASEVAGARSFIGFDDETTGIANINGEAKTLFNGDFYNIAGQRVAQPTKGLYIVNGKKVIIK